MYQYESNVVFKPKEINAFISLGTIIAVNCAPFKASAGINPPLESPTLFVLNQGKSNGRWKYHTIHMIIFFYPVSRCASVSNVCGIVVKLGLNNAFVGTVPMVEKHYQAK